MDFKWDSKKAKANFEKRGITFEEASTVFYDPFAKLGHDPDHSEQEDRFILIGHSQKNNLLFVIHVYKEDEQTIRIVSARKATKKEKHDFENI
ncbi:MAG: BrnT family toxin [Pseudobdellovibrionaceae bacterium]